MKTVALYTNWHVWTQRPHHLVSVLNDRGARVDVFGTRGVRSKGPPIASPNTLTTHVYLPVSQQHRAPIRIGNGWIRRALEERFVRAKADVHIHGQPPQHPLSKKPPVLVYDCLDDWSAYPGWTGKTEEHEQRLCEQADHVWVISKPLYERFRDRFGAKVQYVPNGVEYGHFARTPSLRKPRQGPPVLGYVGALSKWFDVELVRSVAERLPGWEVRLVGPVELDADAKKRLDLPNVKFLGRKPYDELPAILAGFDVATIPFLLTDLIKATSPIKLYEYLAAGLPVVSCAMPEVLPLVEPGVVACTSDAETFAKEAEAMLALDRTPRRQELARGFSWAARFAEPLAALGL